IPPYVVSCVITILVSWNSGRMEERGYHISSLLLIGICGFLYLILSKNVALYFGAFIACIGSLTLSSLILSWATNNIGGQTKRTVVTALVVGFGNIGGILSGFIYGIENDSPYYHKGHCIMLGFMCCAFLLLLVFKFLLTCENSRREKLTHEQFALEAVVSRFSDKHPRFRYIT
ncbi:unnamed protein product, partial [Didymodactylos carnosus]